MRAWAFLALLASCASHPVIEAHLSLTSESLAVPVIQEINGARETLDIAIYSLTLDPIAQAIARAHGRGVKTRLIMDKAQAGNKHAKDEELAGKGIPVERDTMSGLMHDKFAIIDGERVVTGSFNWTENAEGKNAENLVVIRSKETAQAFQKEFDALWKKNAKGLIKVEQEDSGEHH